MKRKKANQKKGGLVGIMKVFAQYVPNEYAPNGVRCRFCGKGYMDNLGAVWMIHGQPQHLRCHA